MERTQPSLLYDPRVDEVVSAQRAASDGGLGPRDKLAVGIVGTTFLAVALALMFTIPEQRNPGIPVVAVFVATFAFLSRLEFEIFNGASVPTQLAFVPMLFVLPLRIVPLVVAAGMLIGSSIDWIRGRTVAERLLLNLSSSWYTVGPVLVLWAFGDRPLAWSNWPILVAALLAQFGVELGGVAAHEWIAGGASVREVLPYLARAQIVDAALASTGLAVAFASVENGFGVLLALPLAGLLGVFARERSIRIDYALELSAAYRGTAFLLGDVIDGDDAYTGAHSRDVVELAIAVAERLGLSDDERRDAEFVALLHDVGKIRIPAEIINKAGPLTPEERSMMQTHTLEGEKLLDQVGGLLGQVGRVVRSCHERWDGNGYPDGLRGEEIPQVARIVTCCDAFSAMTTDRAYRRALPIHEAIAELHANAGTQFDPDVVRALVSVVEEGSLTRLAT